MDHTGSQIRAARSLVGWSASRLAKEAGGLSLSTVQRTEAGRQPTGANGRAIVAALERVGVEFVPGGAKLVDRK